MRRVVAGGAGTEREKERDDDHNFTITFSYLLWEELERGVVSSAYDV